MQMLVLARFVEIIIGFSASVRSNIFLEDNFKSILSIFLIIFTRHNLVYLLKKFENKYLHNCYFSLLTKEGHKI